MYINPKSLRELINRSRRNYVVATRYLSRYNEELDDFVITKNIYNYTVNATFSDYSGIFDISQKSLFCSSVCSEWFGTDCTMGVGKHDRREIHIGGSVLCSIFCEWYLWICELEEDGTEAKYLTKR